MHACLTLVRRDQRERERKKDLEVYLKTGHQRIRLTCALSLEKEKEIIVFV